MDLPYLLDKLADRIGDLESEVARLQRPDVVLTEAERLLRAACGDDGRVHTVRLNRRDVDIRVSSDAFRDVCAATLAEAYAALTGGEHE